ncbi:vitamin K epoxide reductase family protein [Candidatus Woesearchaeota archaeon]|nr:vitamin K epoxide reductase family protein [Candidatus Woesearchaeota archaeon]
MNIHDHHKKLLWTICFLSLFGLILSSYLLWVHYQPVETICLAFGGDNGCDIVNKGPYAEIMSFPIAGLGVLGYLAFIITSLLALHKDRLRNTWLESYGEKATSYLLIFALGALAFTIYFNYLQIFVIGTICSLCELSATIVVILLTISLLLRKK